MQALCTLLAVVTDSPSLPFPSIQRIAPSTKVHTARTLVSPTRPLGSFREVILPVRVPRAGILLLWPLVSHITSRSLARSPTLQILTIRPPAVTDGGTTCMRSTFQKSQPTALACAHVQRIHVADKTAVPRVPLRGDCTCVQSGAPVEKP